MIYNLGLVYYHLNNLEESLYYLEQAICIENDFSDIKDLTMKQLMKIYYRLSLD